MRSIERFGDRPIDYERLNASRRLPFIGPRPGSCAARAYALPHLIQNPPLRRDGLTCFALFGEVGHSTAQRVVATVVAVYRPSVVNNTVRANKFVSTAVGVPKITSATNIELNAGGAVIIGSSQLRIKSFTTAERDALTAATGDIIYNSTLSKMQLRIASAWKSITISDDVPTNNNQLTNGAGYITDASSANSHTFTMTANGASDYVFASDSKFFTTNTNDPVLYLRRGDTYTFVNNSGGSHPFQIRTNSGGSAYSTGVTNNGASSGNIVFTVPMGAPATLYYQCISHSGMGNTINIV